MMELQPQVLEGANDPEFSPSPTSNTIVASPSSSQRNLNLKLLSAGFSFFAAGTNDGCLGSLIPYILTSYDIGAGEIAILYICTFLGWFLAAVINTHSTQYINLGALLCLGAGFQLLSQSLRVWKPPFALFAVSFFLTGLGQAIQDSHSNTFVSSVNGAHRWLGFIHAMYGFGLLVSPFVATAMTISLDGRWELFYLVLIGIGVTNLGMVLRAFWESVSMKKRSEIGEQRSGSAFRLLRQLLGMKNVWAFSIFFFFHLGVATTSGGWIVEYLVQARHGTLRQMGYVPSGFYGGLCLGRLLLVEPTHRFGEHRMLILYSVLCLVTQLIFWLVPHLGTAIVMLSLLGFLLGPFFAAGISVSSKVFPSHIQPAALGLIFVIAQAGAALFPSLIGIIASHAGVKVLPPIVAGLIVGMGILWGFVPRIPDDEHVE